MLDVVCGPEQVVRPGREIRQSRIVDAAGAMCLVRVVVDRTDGDIRIVPVYRTTKFAKYWSIGSSTR